MLLNFRHEIFRNTSAKGKLDFIHISKAMSNYFINIDEFGLNLFFQNLKKAETLFMSKILMQQSFLAMWINVEIQHCISYEKKGT